jgi:5'-nucleotidase
VLSGINVGSNIGRAVLHSGTVGAALTAGLHGWRALAVSLDTGWDPPPHPHWDAVAHVLPGVLDVLLGEDDGTVLNLNVPDRAPAELGELREARLAQFGSVQIRVDQRSADGVEALHMTLGEPSEAPHPDSDTALLRQGHPTVTRLESISARSGVLGTAVALGT